jgi:hypothetical protein
MAKSFDQTDSNRIGTLHKDDRDGLSCRLCRKRAKRALKNNEHGDRASDQFGDEDRKLVVSAIAPAVFDPQVFAFNKAVITEALVKGSEILPRQFRRVEMNKADDRHCLLLCCAGERAKGGHAGTDEREEVTSPHHSMTSSARASSDCGTVMPSATRGLQIDHQLELGRLLDRQVSRLRALDDLVHEDGGPLIGP